MIVIDLSNQQALDADPRAFNILERLEIQNVQERQLCSLSQETEIILDFSQGTVKFL